MDSIWILCIICCFTGSEASSGEDKLFEDIFTNRNYNSMSRPVQYHNETVQVMMDIAISQIVDIDEMNEIIKLSMWKRWSWTDHRLKWDKAEYEGVDNVRVPNNKIWIPDVVLYNRAEGEPSNEDDANRISINNEGLCFYSPFEIASAQCTIDIRWFPFDDQFCLLHYVSWTYHMSELNLSIGRAEADLSPLKTNTEWTLLSADGERYEDKYDETYSNIRYTLHLRRKTLYYVFNLILPCALISTLTALSFQLPTESGERVSLCITALLAQSVYQTIVIERIPASSDSLPIIGVYFFGLICINIAGIIVTIASVNMYHQHSEITHIPRWVHELVNVKLARFLRMSPPPGIAMTIKRQTQVQPIAYDLICGSKGNNNSLFHENVDESSRKSAEKVEILDRDYIIIVKHGKAKLQPTDCGQILDNNCNGSVEQIPEPGVEEKQNSKSSSEAKSNAELTAKQVAKLTNALELVLGKVSNSEKSKKVEDSKLEEWKFTSKVLDKACFWIIAIFEAVTTVMIFVIAASAKHYQH